MLLLVHINFIGDTISSMTNSDTYRRRGTHNFIPITNALYEETTEPIIVYKGQSKNVDTEEEMKSFISESTNNN